jgi:anti-sigma regulatory factor (Ser/Thr protein kinase)
MGAEQHASSQHSGRLKLQVPAAPNVLSRVRQAIRDLGLPPPLLDDAVLLVNELVTNSIRHSGIGPEDRVRVRAEWSGTRLRVDVYDRAESAAPSWVAGTIRPSAGAESGWGLYLIDRLGTRWGTGPGRYWFELELGRSVEGRG